MARKIVVALSRGGGAKTLTSVHIAKGLAEKKKKVLLVDTDPQGDCLQYFYTEEAETLTKNGGLYNFMRGEKSLEEVVLKPTKYLDLLPGSEDLKLMLNELIVKDMGKEFVLADALEQVEENYDYIIIDTTPTQTIMNLNAYFYAEELLVPYWLQPSTFKNMKEFVNQYERIAELQNRLFKSVSLKFKYILPVMNVKTEAARSSMKELLSLVFLYKNLSEVDYEYAHYKELTLLDPIPRRTKFEQLPNFGKTIFDQEPNGEEAKAYSLAVKEILKNEQKAKR